MKATLSEVQRKLQSKLGVEKSKREELWKKIEDLEGQLSEAKDGKESQE